MLFNLNKDRFIRSARLSIAIIIGLVIMYLIKLPHSIWIIITVIVVLFDQSTVGGTLQRGMLRITATIISAIIGLIVLYVFKNNMLINEATVIIVTFIYAYYFIDTKQSHVGVLGSATLAMILLMDIGDGMNAPIFRASTIIIGVLVAITTMLCFFPQYAKRSADTFLMHLICQMEKIVTSFIDPNVSLTQLHTIFVKEENKYISKITKFNRLIDEAQFEIRRKNKKVLTKARYQAILLQFRRIHRLIGVLIHHVPNNDVRFNLELTESLRFVVNRLQQVKYHLKTLNSPKKPSKVNTQEHSFSEMTMALEDTASNESKNNQDLHFIHSLLKCIINETNLLCSELF